MANVVPNDYKERLLGNATQVRWDTDTIKATLHTSSLTPNEDSDDFYDDVSGSEVPASGTYALGGATLTPTVSQDNTDNEGVVDAVDLSFTTATIAARYVVIRKDTGVASTSPILVELDLGSTIVSTLGTFSVVWAAEGILNIG